MTEFRPPPKTLPPPGAPAPRLVLQLFLPEEDAAPPPDVETGPLEVLRFAPEGEIALALPQRHLQPADGSPSHARRTGRARRAGHPNARPARRLEVDRDQDASSSTAMRLASASPWRPSIPSKSRRAWNAIRLAASWRSRCAGPSPRRRPRSPTGRRASARSRGDPLLFAAFDQRIDPAAVLETVQAAPRPHLPGAPRHGRGDRRRLRRPQKLFGAERAGEGRWLALFRRVSYSPRIPPSPSILGRARPRRKAPHHAQCPVLQLPDLRAAAHRLPIVAATAMIRRIARRSPRSTSTSTTPSTPSILTRR